MSATPFAADLDAVADLGWGLDRLDQLAKIGMPPGAFATFLALEPDTRALVLRQLDSPTDEDLAEFEAHPACRSLADWLLTLPAYINAPEDDEDDWPEATGRG